MGTLIDAYLDLLIKQYWDKPKARAELTAQVTSWEVLRDHVASWLSEFDLDTASGDRLDKIGAIVGLPRLVPYTVAKIAFGFSDNPDARGFDDKFTPAVSAAPFLDKFSPAYTTLELDDVAYRILLRAKIAANVGSAFMVSDSRISIQDVVNAAFAAQAYVTDGLNMGLTLYVSPVIELEYLRAIVNLGLLPKPQGVRYDYIILADPIDTFGFADNPNARGFADKFDPNQSGGRLAEKVIL